MRGGLRLLLLSFTLSSCSHSSTTTQISNGINQSLDELEQGWPKGCETSSTKATINSIRAQVASCNQACDDRVAIEKQKNKTLWVALISILTLCGIYIAKKIFK